jgi:hypothetical protein
MDGKRARFAHVLLFRCKECREPLTTCAISEDRGLEKIDATPFDLGCKCGSVKTYLGMEAVRRWVTPWKNVDDPAAI